MTRLQPTTARRRDMVQRWSTNAKIGNRERELKAATNNNNNEKDEENTGE